MINPVKYFPAKTSLARIALCGIERKSMRLLTVAVLVLSLSNTAHATPTIQCHCFRDRSFDPQNPTGADLYILATTQNSFLASVFGVSKQEIVRAKMSGVDGDDLWIAYYLAGSTSADAEGLLAEEKRVGSWPPVVERHRTEALKKGARFHAVLIRGASRETLAASVVDELLIQRLHVKPADVKQARDLGATTKETISAIFLSLRSESSPSDVYRAVTAGKASWGSLLNASGISEKQIESEWRKILKGQQTHLQGDVLEAVQ